MNLGTRFIMYALLAVLALCISADAKKSRKLKHPRSFINPYPRFNEYKDGGDPGEPLFLTPLIHDEKIPKDQVRKKAAVIGSQFHDVESYAGYLTVDAGRKSNMFFWHFPAEKDPTYAPVVLWLQGGPGASSLFGLFAENGPFEFDSRGHLQKRNYTWSRTHNLIYIDNPVGTGFSFTGSDEGYARNEKDVGRNLHEAVMQLYELFGWNNSSGFWITGESYAGKYVPALAYHIHLMQNAVDTRVYIPLNGLAIGNGLTDPLHQLKYGDYLYQLGLIDDNGLKEFHTQEAKGEKCIKDHDMDCAFDIFDGLINGDLTNGSIFHNLTGYNFYYNYLKTDSDEPGEALGNFIQSTLTRRAIHVGNMTFHDTDKVNKVEKFLKEDVMDTVAPWVAELLNEYIVCIYSGQLDIIVAYPLTRNYLNHLKFADADKYKIAERRIWRVDNEIAGYVKHAGRLIEILVRNAGHMAPGDQPKWLHWMIDHLTHYKTVE
ncbi:venom serine carboxypeptidase [Anastrepha ludens]|uniref:venom serine carboxypeptidase n=1 Tax=Anastrepha ludens TaxID=28586 RepID=UPI0023AF351B|nr:venom serine carboxypeptidase [Anastrepha ludens]XP_053965199.1 venom serine carboxypeptidase [Anastrepha ludens]XP_053965205.1 venom serine carboxypeptidase [Anastrepha ludens]